MRFVFNTVCFQNKPVLSFSSPPSFSISDSEDAEAIARLRDYYQHNSREYSSLLEVFERKGKISRCAECF